VTFHHDSIRPVFATKVTNVTGSSVLRSLAAVSGYRPTPNSFLEHFENLSSLKNAYVDGSFPADGRA